MLKSWTPGQKTIAFEGKLKKFSKKAKLSASSDSASWKLESRLHFISV